MRRQRRLDDNGTHGCQNLMSVVDTSYPYASVTLMSSIKPLSTSVTILLLVAVAAFEGCASLTSLVASNKESLLSAAGFRTRTPSTPDKLCIVSLRHTNSNVGQRMAKSFILTRTSKKGSYTSAARLSINSTSVWLWNGHLSRTIQKIRGTTTDSPKANSMPLR